MPDLSCRQCAGVELRGNVKQGVAVVLLWLRDEEDSEERDAQREKRDEDDVCLDVCAEYFLPASLCLAFFYSPFLLTTLIHEPLKYFSLQEQI